VLVFPSPNKPVNNSGLAVSLLSGKSNFIARVGTWRSAAHST
jgi:hypothetical protein